MYCSSCGVDMNTFYDFVSGRQDKPFAHEVASAVPGFDVHVVGKSGSGTLKPDVPALVESLQV